MKSRSNQPIGWTNSLVKENQLKLAWQKDRVRKIWLNSAPIFEISSQIMLFNPAFSAHDFD